MIRLFALMGLFLAIASPAPAAMNMGVSVGDITVASAWSRSSAGMAHNGAAFVTIANKGGADRLVSAATPVASRAELHTHLMEGGVMKMRQVEGIDVPANGSVELKPGGLHIMLFKLTQPLSEGDHYPLKLTFEKAGSVTVMVKVGKAGSMDHSKMKMPAAQ